MVINFLGDGSFKIQTGGLTILTEPFSGELSGRFKPDIILRTQAPKSYKPKADCFIVEGPGEYEIKGVHISGFPGFSFLVRAEEMNLGFGNPDVDEVDILFLPAHGSALKIIKQLEPKIVVPAGGDIKDLAGELNQKVIPEEKLVVKSKDLPAEGPKLVVLKTD